MLFKLAPVSPTVVYVPFKIIYILTEVIHGTLVDCWTNIIHRVRWLDITLKSDERFVFSRIASVTSRPICHRCCFHVFSPILFNAIKVVFNCCFEKIDKYWYGMVNVITTFCTKLVQYVLYILRTLTKDTGKRF